MNTFFKYNAIITRVVDGDTVDALVDLGFKVQMKIRFRLSGFDAPETYRPKDAQEKEAGMRATASLVGMVEGKEVIVKSNRFGKYRYLAELYLPDQSKSINQIMVELGHIKKGK